MTMSSSISFDKKNQDHQSTNNYYVLKYYSPTIAEGKTFMNRLYSALL